MEEMKGLRVWISPPYEGGDQEGVGIYDNLPLAPSFIRRGNHA